MAMAVNRILAVGGLQTDPSALIDARALRRADNVSLHRPGVITPRPGFGDTTGITARSVTRRPVAIVPYAGDLVIQSLTGSTWTLERGGAATTYAAAGAPPEVGVRGVSSFAQARGNLYFTTEFGIMKISAIGDSLALGAGIPTDYTTPFVSGTTNLAYAERRAMPSDAAVAYRYCWVTEDVNGYVRRSAPSARWIVQAPAPAGSHLINEFDQIYLPPDFSAGSKLEIYRTEHVTPSTSTPGTEYFLAAVYVVTADDVTNGFIPKGTIYDDVPDSRLGATLYTSPSQGGIQQSNDIPPLANVIAWWRDVMWFGNTQSRHAFDLELINVYDDDDTNGRSDRIGWHCSLHEGDTVSGNNKITGLKDSAGVAGKIRGLKVGQYVTDASNGPTVAGTVVPALTTVTACTTSVTINNALLAANDTIKIWGETFTWVAGAPSSSQIQIGASSALSAANLAARLHGRDYLEDVSISAIASGAGVTITEASGHGTQIAVTGTGQTVSYEVAMSVNASATSTNGLFFFHDWISINGTIFFADIGGGGISQASGFADSQYRLAGGDFEVDTATTAQQLSECATGIERAINGYAIEASPNFGVRVYRDVDARLSSASVGDGYMTIFRERPELGTFTVQCSVRPEAWRPDIATAKTTETTRVRSRLYWSKPQEPEAVPILNFVDIGRRDADILALVPLEDALLVFKEDGIYSVQGTAPSSWIVSEVDLSKRLLSSQCVCVLGGVCYAWTDHGVCAVTAAGARVVSGAIGDQMRELQRLLPADNTDHKRAFWMVARPRMGYVLLGTGSAADSTSSTAQWQFVPETGRWSKWTLDSRCMAYDPAEDRLVTSRAIDAWHVCYERTDEDDAASYRDASLSGLSATFDENVIIAKANFGGFVPAVGDVIVDDDDGAARVTAVSDTGAAYDISVSIALQSSPVRWHEGYEVAIEWQAQSLPGRGGRWGEQHHHFRATENEYLSSFPILIGGAANQNSVETVTHTHTPPAILARVGPPRNIVRANRLYPHISINTAGSLWTLESLDLHYSPAGTRVAR